VRFEVDLLRACHPLNAVHHASQLELRRSGLPGAFAQMVRRQLATIDPQASVRASHGYLNVSPETHEGPICSQGRLARSRAGAASRQRPGRRWDHAGPPGINGNEQPGTEVQKCHRGVRCGDGDEDNGLRRTGAYLTPSWKGKE